MEKVWAAEIQRALKNTNDAQAKALLYQLHLERENATATSSSYSEGDLASASSAPTASPARKLSSKLSPLTTQTKIDGPVITGSSVNPYAFRNKPKRPLAKTID